MHYGYSLRLYSGQTKFFGPGVAELLQAVESTGSLRQAAASMKMAYSKAWHIMKNAETALGFSLISSQTGGRSGGGAELTPEGRNLLHKYNSFRARLKEHADALFAEFFGESGPA